MRCQKKWQLGVSPPSWRVCSGRIAQDLTPTPQTSGQPVATTVEVIVTGSNIPTAEEVGPQPVDTYRNIDIERLGVRSATDLVQKLPIHWLGDQ